jgi:Cof subfamily protein (haloacid dehalogenase superfamily)
MNIKAVCTDIDGTLLDARRELSEKTISVFHSIADKLPVILASSRMPSAMTHLQKELNITGHPIIAYNGGYVIQYQKDQLLVFDSVFISAEICESILQLVAGTNINMSLYFEDSWYAPSADQWTEREERITKVKAEIKNPQDVISEWRRSGKGAHKVMLMGPEGQISIAAGKLQEKHGDDIHIYFSRSTYLELAPRSISKASALKLVLQKLFNIPMEEVMAFGDNFNDIDMLKSVGFGVAVANAREEAKAVARFITERSIDDGVAIAIEKYLY